MKTLEYILLNIKRIGYSRVLTQLNLVHTLTQDTARQQCIKELEEEYRYLKELIYTMCYSGVYKQANFKTNRFPEHTGNSNYINHVKPPNVMVI